MTIRLGGVRIRPAGGGGGAGPTVTYLSGSIEDPSVSLLLHGAGTDGGTTFTDSSAYALTPSYVDGSPTTRSGPTDGYKNWGTSSILFRSVPGNMDAIQYANNSLFAFGTSSFTLEGWIYPTEASVYGSGPDYSDYACAPMDITPTDAGGGSGILFFISTTGHMIVYCNQAGGEILRSSSGVIGLQRWNHWAIVRSGSSNFYFYANGNRVASGTLSLNVTSGACTINTTKDFIGRAGRRCYAYMDEIRVTKGGARYTGSTYTVPSAPFPDGINLTALPAPTKVDDSTYTDDAMYRCTSLTGPTWQRYTKV